MVAKRKTQIESNRDWTARSIGFTVAVVIVYLLFLQIPNLAMVGQIQSRVWGVSSEFNQLFGLLIVVVELMALPYLLTLGKSSLIRLIGAIAASGIFLYWMVIGLVTIVSNEMVNVGLLGELLPLPGGEWFLMFMTGMLGVVLLYEMLVQKWHLAPLEKTPSK